MTEKEKAPLHLKCTSPCTTCPYRKDAKLRHWHKKEFETLMKSEKDYFGTVYACHKKNGSVCIGWLIMQDKNNLPSIALRIKLSTSKTTREYLDSLNCESEMFETTEEMIYENYHELYK